MGPLESLVHGSFPSLPVMPSYRYATERLAKTLRDKMKKHETYEKSFSFKVHTYRYVWYFDNRFVISTTLDFDFCVERFEFLIVYDYVKDQNDNIILALGTDHTVYFDLRQKFRDGNVNNIGFSRNTAFTGYTDVRFLTLVRHWCDRGKSEPTQYLTTTTTAQQTTRVCWEKRIWKQI